MEEIIKKFLVDLDSSDDRVRGGAFNELMRLTSSRVDWVYEVWEDLLSRLDSPNSYQRSIGILLLCNLSQSDDEHRLNTVIEKLLEHTKDEKFITSRQCLQHIWKPALYNPELRESIVSHLQKRFVECEVEKHANLLRLDILQSLAQLHTHTADPALQPLILDLIDAEVDEKSRKAYQKALAL